ncbi:ATP-binding protein [Luteolibacter marinus]|uniref:ATP-binding protein n=1 Tax=Luteolibacter marinus TaxID=2776705 RepID=UPI001867ABC2|nr:ATP-binding protein [Luteolibacter marinus]
MLVTAGFAAETVRADLPPITLAELGESVAATGREISSFELEGTVCAVGGSRHLIALQDHSSTHLVELPGLPADVVAGGRVRIRGLACAVSRGRHAIRLGTAPVVDVDYHHSSITRAGEVYLEAGLQPLRIDWFNGFSDAALKLEWEGPGFSRRAVPARAFAHREEDGDEVSAGLRYRSYLGGSWRMIPDFGALEPVASGITDAVDVALRPRHEHVGMQFSGLLRVPSDGVYTFHLTSDDGGRVIIGEARASCEAVSGGTALPVASLAVPWEASSDRLAGSWAKAEGVVTFAARMEGRIELDLAGRTASIHATLVDPGDLDPAALIHRRVEVLGVGRAEGIIVVDARHLEVVPNDSGRDEVITRAEDVRKLQPDEASKPFRTKLRGVVTNVSPNSLVIQDPSGGVFVYCSDAEFAIHPNLGELWEIEGTTDPGDFSPMIVAERGRYLGSAPMPEPIVPIWEQLASGSLDAEYVEIEGVVVSASEVEMVLLTRGGKLQVQSNQFSPSPLNDLDASARAALPGSVVRLRGVFTANWDWRTGRVNPGICQLGSSSMVIDEPAPVDPFAADPMHASDLLLFTSHPGAFKRVKVTGVLLHARPPEYYCFDGSEGFRIVSRSAKGLVAGDRVEASGFPRLGGPSPVLLEAAARKAGVDELPEAVVVESGRLPDQDLDSTRVSVQATLLSDTLRRDERVLEMQAGEQRFVARLAANGADPVERGSLLQISGTYAGAPADRSSAGDPFEILLNGPADLRILKRGPWWTLRHTIVTIAVLSGGLLIALIWVLVLRRTVNLRTRQLAAEIEERQTAERHRELEQERSRVAHDLHDELGSGITEAGMLASLVKNPAIPIDRKSDYLDQLSEVCRSMVTGLDEIVWAVNPRYDSVGDLAGYFSLFAQRFLDLAGIHCRLKIDESMSAHPLDSRQRHGLFLAFREALNNVVRHSGARVVTLSIVTGADDLKVSISDDGLGFEQSEANPGSDGLVGMEERLKKIGGGCRVLSCPGQGTTVEFTLPLEAAPS